MEICKKGTSLKKWALLRVGLNVKGKDILVLYCAPHQKTVWGDQR